MGAFCETVFIMNLRPNGVAWLVCGIFAAGVFPVQGQPAGSRANDFTSVEYFEPPNQLTVKSRLSGTEARPEAGGLLLITRLRLETYDTNGEPGLVVKAPQCTYDTQRQVAYSSGHLRLETADGSSHIEGDGFLWRQADSFLTISNNVQTVIENTPERKNGP